MKILIIVFFSLVNVVFSQNVESDEFKIEKTLKLVKNLDLSKVKVESFYQGDFMKGQYEGFNVILNVEKNVNFLGNILSPSTKIIYVDSVLREIRLPDSKYFSVKKVFCVDRVEFQDGNFCRCEIAKIFQQAGVKIPERSTVMFTDNKFSLFYVSSIAAAQKNSNIRKIGTYRINENAEVVEAGQEGDSFNCD